VADQLEQVLADARERAAILKHEGHPVQARSIEDFADRVASAAEDYLRWLSEDDAALRSGRSASWLRSRFAEWERQGHARRDGRRRLYRQVVVPQRANPTAAREAGRAA